MLNESQESHIQTFKISLINEKSKLEINRIFMPIESNIFENDKIGQKQEIKFFSVNISSHETNLNRDVLQQSNKESSSKIQEIMNTIDHQEVIVAAYNHTQYFQTSSVIPTDFSNEQQPSSSNVSIVSSNKTDSLSSVIRIEQSLSPPLSQLIPDSIINDKQATNRIFNEKNSTHFLHPSKFITLTPIDSSQNKTSKSIDNDLSSSNHVRYYHMGSILTSTSTFIMHQNEVIAHVTASNSFLSDTIFIILITTLIVIILLFYLGLFCLCRRTTKRNISPSFDEGSYEGLNGQSFAIPIDEHQQQYSKYENNIPLSSIQTKSSINQLQLTNDRIPLSQSVGLHQTEKQKLKINNKKLKKKRIGFCCCNSKQTSLKTVNARTRMINNEM